MTGNTTCRVLVVEDDAQDFRILARHLESLTRPRYALTRAADFDEARLAIADTEFDIALVDYRLSNIASGLDFIVELGGREASFPAILLTGLDTGDADREALLSGAYDYIDKLSLTRDLVDRSIRFAIQSHAYEKKLRAAVEAATEQASINRNILSVVSHEMKSPISSLIGYCDFLIEGAACETSRDAAKKMKTASIHLEDFLRNLSEFVRLDAASAQPRKSEFRMRTLLEETIAFFQPYAQHKGIALTLETSDTIDATAFGDQLRIRQILINLLKNAVNYSDGGSIRVTGDLVDGRLNVAVADEGVGMSEAKVAAILSDEITPQPPGASLEGGLGLGLSIVRRLLRLMNGRLILESALGFGTTAGFSIPVEISQNADAA